MVSRGLCEIVCCIREIVCPIGEFRSSIRKFRSFIGELTGSIQLSLSIYQRHIKYIGDFRNISAPYQIYQRLSTIYQRPPKNSGPRSIKNEPHLVQLASLNLIKISLFHSSLYHHSILT